MCVDVGRNLSVLYQSPTKPVIPDSRSKLVWRSGEIATSDRTDLNPLKVREQSDSTLPLAIDSPRGAK